MKIFSWESWPVLSSLFRHEQWNIGLVRAPIHTFLDSRSSPQVEWLHTLGREKYWADPFGIVHNGRIYILHELFEYNSLRGKLHCMEFGSEASTNTSREIISAPFHTSYPFVIEYNGATYCIPEMKSANEVVLYRMGESPYEWHRDRTLIPNFSCVDPTIFQHNGLWYLFSGGGSTGHDHDLYIWYSDDLFGTWRPHTSNPVKSGDRRSRPGGTIFSQDGEIYRPAQDGSKTYGGALVIYRIVQLAPDAFLEEEAMTVSPRPGWPHSNGLHTLSAVGDVTLIDAKSFVFSFGGFKHQLKRRAAKIKSKLAVRFTELLVGSP